MSDLLLNWLNDEVQLSKRITNFEEDFHNGFLFGELLNKFSQQLNFNEFIDKDDKNTRIKNFTLLYDTFKTLRVGFDSNIAMNIIEKKTGIAKKVLYQLKMQLQKTNSNAFSKLAKSSKPLSPLKKIPISKDTFDKISKEHFNKQLNQIHRAQKNINLDSHLQKFPEFQKQTLVRTQFEEHKEVQSTLLKHAKFREKQIENIKKSEQFRQDWEQSNQQKWAANMTVRKLQVQKDSLYKSKLENQKIQSKTMSEINAIKALDQDIKNFQKKVLAKKPKDDSDSDNQLQEPAISDQPKFKKNPSGSPLKSFNNITINNRSKMSETVEGEEIRQKKTPQQVEAIRHQREKRRRKMIVEQSKKHQLIKIERREKYLLSTLQQNSKQEKQIEYEIWRAWQNKQIIIQNKQSNNEKIKDKEETRAINAKFKDDELVKTYREEHQAELKNALERQRKLKVDNSVMERKKIYSQCKSIVENFISMTEVLFEFGQQRNAEEIDQTFVNHLLDEFIVSASKKKQIAELELKNYIQGKGQWNIQVTKTSEEQPEEPTMDNALPAGVVNNYYLGNILKTVFGELYKQQQCEQQKQEVKCKNLVSLLGLQFAGKSELSLKLKQQFHFNIIFVNELIQQKLSELNDGRPSEQIQQLADYCYQGKQIPTSLIISLIKSETQKYDKNLIVNFPITYEECIEFTRQFGSIEPSDFRTKSKFVMKVEEFSRLVWPTETKYIPRSLKPCGLDFALWLDISPKTSFDRFLGRRWTPQGECLHINQQIPNPNTLTVGNKASPVILKNNFKINNRQKIKNWLSEFGTKVVNNDEELVQSCWEQISGQKSIEEVTENVIALFNKALDVKEKKVLQTKLKQQKLKEEQKNKEERDKFEEELKQKCALTNAQTVKEKFEEAIAGVKMDKEFLEKVENLWNMIEKATVATLCNVFQTQRDQESEKNKYISDIKRNFIRLLTREDQRFYLVKKFQNQYNQFFEESADMISQDYTKEELHQRIQDLETDLLTLIEDKKQDAVNQRQAIMNSGWLQNQLEQIIGSAHVLLQTELNRTFTCQQIITDFYSKKFMVNTGQIEEGQQELNIDDTLDLYKNGTSPRLDKLIADATRLFNKEQQAADDKNKKGGKAPPKKDDKKPAKKGGKQQVQEVKQISAQEIQFKKALNTQKSIFRYRVQIILGFTSKKLQEYNKAGTKLYQDLEDLYRYTDKVENHAVVEMTKIFKQAIENEEKIQNQVQINYTHVQETQLIRNFLKPKPVILPATEKAGSDRFTISAISYIFKIFSRESEAGVTIKTRRLIALFSQLMVNEQYRVYLPQSWKNISQNQFLNFISKFDKEGKGEIQLWIIFTVIALSNVPLATDRNIQEFILNATNHNPTVKELSREDLIKAPAWFDSEQPIEENVREFDRNRHLKSLLFDIFKKNENEMNVDKFCKKIKVGEFRTGVDEEGLTYFDFAFPSS